MIGHAPLREVVRTDAFAAIARAHLTAAIRRNGVRLLLLCTVVETCPQHLHRLLAVFQLRFLVLTLDDDARREMRDTDRRLRTVDVLPARPRRTVGVDAQIVRIDGHLDLLCLRQDSDRHRRGVDAPAGLGDGNALDAMRPALILEFTVCTGTADEKGDLLEPADLCRIAAEHLGAPTLSLGVACIHAKETRSKKCRLLAAHTAANLDNDILIIVRVARQEEDRQLGGETVALRLRRRDLLHEHRLHLGIGLGEHLLILINGGKRPSVGLVRLNDRRERRVLACVTLPHRHIRHHGWITEQCFELTVFIFYCSKFA